MNAAARAAGALVVAVAGACGRAPPVASRAAAVHDGVSLAIYQGPGPGVGPGAGPGVGPGSGPGVGPGSGAAYGVVDDRRWIDLAGDTLVIDRVDPRAALPSLVIEPLAGGALEVGACLRDRIPDAPAASAPTAGAARSTSAPVTAPPATAAPAMLAGSPGHAAFSTVLRCAVHAARGRHLVRVLYVVTGLGYRAQHDVAMTAAGRASVTSRFAIVTPAWHVRAEIALFDGTPGGERPVRELARGTATLDGGTAVISVPARDVPARLRRIYHGAVADPDGDDGSPREPRWRQASQPAVCVWLELDDPALVRAPVHAHVALGGEPPRELDVAVADGRRAAAGIRVPLWIDDQLRGKRDRSSRGSDPALVDRFLVSVANTGDAPREVWVEEPLRPVPRRTIGHAWPVAPIVAGDQLRMKLTVAAGKLERGGFEIVYEP